MIKIFNNRYK